MTNPETKKRIVTVVGARPQFVKAALLSAELLKSESLEEILVHTGQHYDENMSEIFFREMGIPEPAQNLHIAGGGHGEMTGRMMIELERLFSELSPDLCLIYGDTNSTLAAAIVAGKLHIPVAHVEGGLRNHDLSIPEEINRVVSDRLSSIIFYPTKLALQNLQAEGFESFPCQLVGTGDLMYDACLKFSPLAKERMTEFGSDFILTTIHRQSNTTESGLQEAFGALNELAENHNIVFPMHPRTRKALEHSKMKLHPSVKLLEPVGYFDMLALLTACKAVITDSGGLQKEAYALGKKALVLLEFTPWTELVEAGYVSTTVGKKSAILEAWQQLQELEPQNVSLYGKGDSAEVMVKALESYLSR